VRGTSSKTVLRLGRSSGLARRVPSESEETQSNAVQLQTYRTVSPRAWQSGKRDLPIPQDLGDADGSSSIDSEGV